MPFLVTSFQNWEIVVSFPHSKQNRDAIAHLPEYISSFTVSSLQYLGRQIHLVPFTFKGTTSAVYNCPDRSRRSGPNGCHSKIPYFEAAFSSYENIGRLQVQVDNASIMDESKALVRRHENEPARPILLNTRY